MTHFRELTELSELLADYPQDLEPWSPEWMMRQSLVARQTEIFQLQAIESGEDEIELAIVGDPVIAGTIDSSFLGRFLSETQMTISSVAQTIVHGETRRGNLSADVLESSTLRLAGTRRGSFVLGFQGPLRHAEPALLQTSELEEEAPLPVFDEAFGKVLDLFDAVEQDTASERLPEAIADLGGRRPLTHLEKVAKLVAGNGVAATATSRSRFLSEPRSSGISTAGARRLANALSRTSVEIETFASRGHLSGVRWRGSSLFDLELEDGQILSGKIARDLRDAVRDAFDREIVATLEKTTTRVDVAEQARVTYQLVGIGGSLF